MKGEWKVQRSPVGDGESLYIVYRLKDTEAVDHSGNREHGSSWLSSREEAQAIADKLNAIRD